MFIVVKENTKTGECNFYLHLDENEVVMKSKCYYASKERCIIAANKVAEKLGIPVKL